MLYCTGIVQHEVVLASIIKYLCFYTYIHTYIPGLATDSLKATIFPLDPFTSAGASAEEYEEEEFDAAVPPP